MSFLVIIRDVYEEFYKDKLTIKLAHKTFKEFFEYYKTSNEERDEEFRYEKVNEFFKIFFGLFDISDETELNKKIKDIETYISVTNSTTLDNYSNNNDWGKVGNIRSSTKTGRKLSVFLDRLNDNEKAQDFVIWFFENIYNENKYHIGIQKNVHIYEIEDGKDTVNENRFIIRFEYEDKTNIFSIKFEKGNKYRSIFLVNAVNIQDYLHGYNEISKKIEISDKISDIELRNIKDGLTSLLEKIK